MICNKFLRQVRGPRRKKRAEAIQAENVRGECLKRIDLNRYFIDIVFTVDFQGQNEKTRI